MADLDLTIGGNARIPWAGVQKISMLESVVDVAALLIADAGSDLASASQITAAENIAVIDIPDNTWVMQVNLRVIVACTDVTATVDIGDGDDVEAYNAAVDITAAVGTNAWANADADSASLQIGSGKIYSAADQIDVLFNNNTTDGIFVVQVLVADFGFQYKDSNHLSSVK